jgi:hypothetical protein
VLGVAVAVQQHDGGRAYAGIVSRAQIAARRFQIDGAELLALGRHALVDLDDALVEQLGQDDVADEELGAVLIGDAQRVGEAFGDDQDGALALAFEQRVGRDRGAHLDGVDRRGGKRRVGGEAEQVADTLQGGVAVLLGIFGEQLVGDEAAVGPPRHDISEGAATVDPELPARRTHPIRSRPFAGAL